ncbi:uncharacterized protein LOC118344733 isoform X2 [Juglans regia]|uniref:Uncharacterized protein LOC118344733 isoform X2 n=1 Tax=Juglans regia TaxID=51240 RepID=A0A6P9EGJ2_JUGRE|nr:uncharacterized protein LOC118344733 isoform X2 [Juglans regia]
MLMTFNLHEDQPPDSPNSWEKRRDLCISVITSYSPVILCTQQGVKSQLDYLQQGLPENLDRFNPKFLEVSHQDFGALDMKMLTQSEKSDLIDYSSVW